jgi:hypothetical protein
MVLPGPQKLRGHRLALPRGCFLPVHLASPQLLALPLCTGFVQELEEGPFSFPKCEYGAAPTSKKKNTRAAPRRFPSRLSGLFFCLAALAGFYGHVPFAPLERGGAEAEEQAGGKKRKERALGKVS